MDTYEKKYNEALERARNLMEQVRNNELLGFPDQFTEIFPEIRVDEDERVRKVIVKYFKELHEQLWINLEIPDILTWLEKQKEQKPADNEKVEITDFEQSVYDLCPVLGIEEAKATASELLELAKKTLLKTGKVVLASNYPEGCSFEDGFHLGYNEGFNAKQEQKPAEWSEEDEKMLARIIERGQSQIQMFETGLLPEHIAWLKSLRSSWKPREEQMNALNFAITYFMHETNYKNPTELRDLYDDLLKLK